MGGLVQGRTWADSRSDVKNRTCDAKTNSYLRSMWDNKEQVWLIRVMLGSRQEYQAGCWAGCNNDVFLNEYYDDYYVSTFVLHNNAGVHFRVHTIHHNHESQVLVNLNKI